MIDANNTLCGGLYLKETRLLLIMSQSELARRNLRSPKDDRDGRRRERNDSSRSAIHKRLLIRITTALCIDGESWGRGNFEWPL